MSAASSRFVKVFLLDDHDIVRQGLIDLLSRTREVSVVGDTGSARTAVESIPRAGTDVMVLDLHLQDGNGVHVCRRVRATDASIAGLLLTSADDDEALMAAVLAGAAGFVVKLAHSGDIVGAIRRVGGGQNLLDRALRDRAVDLLRSRVRDLDPPPTERQLRILDLVLEGRTDLQIADAVGLELRETVADLTPLVDRVMGV